ncbi:hypothetical protein M8C21_018350 [Ambrosia artemisiifolia]|uniref:ABC-type xenobiotic transporter n=1 Tax=Ambrosia artemisiifolia TaxID=4212 RepID=A0AAD5G2R4_AMBAR|nr:hypothetical protein M8C21_018350 [Ambrosia artemisiifolia]
MPNNRIMLSSLVLVDLNLVMCLLNLLYWYRNGWNIENIVSFSVTVFRTLVWLFVSGYLHNHVFKSAESKYPFALRIWWFSSFLNFGFCLVLDYVFYQQIHSLAPQFFVLDVSSVIVGLFLCYVGLSVKNKGGTISQFYYQSLLDDSDSKREGETITITPSATSNIFSLVTFAWIHPLISVGYKKRLDLEDVPQLDSLNSAQTSFLVLRNKLEFDRSKRSLINTFSLVKAVILTIWKDIIISGFLYFVATLASYVGPFLIDTLVKYLNGQRELNAGLLLVSAFFGAKIVECLAARHYDFKHRQAGENARAALVAMIYHKGLSLSSQSKKGHSNGEIINLMAVDAERIGDFSKFMHAPWMTIVQVCLSLGILYKNLGISALATFIATIVVMLTDLPLGSFQEKYQAKLMEYKDKRMKTTSEILKNMRILKLYGWEMKFLSRINDIRNDEAHWLYKFVFAMAVTCNAFWVAPTLVAIATFGTSMLAGIPLDSGKVLSAVATFKILQESVYTLPDTISMIIQTKVSFDRIASFLSLSELDSGLVEVVPRGSSDTSVEIFDGNFSWDVTSCEPTLTDVNLKVFHHMKVAVCGPVGSGKSSLLSCMLGEVPKLSGKVKLSGTKAYVGQSPWIQSGTVEQNILFGKEMDRESYEKVLEACDLKKDLEVLSAVDAITGNHLFKECMMDYLEFKTVIYVTHQVDFLPAADLILVLKDGRITQAGKYDDIMKLGSDFLELVGAHKEALLEIDSVGSEIIDGSEKHGTLKKNIQDETITGQNGKEVHMDGKKRQLVQEEKRKRGKVGSSAYWKYLTTAYGGALTPVVLLAHIMFESSQISSNYWLAWASRTSESHEAHVDDFNFIMVYVAFGIGCSFCILARSFLLMLAGYETANRLFDKMHFSIFRAPMSFFDANPSGRILNRVSSDQTAVDLTIPYNIGPFAYAVIQLLGIVLVMSLGAWPVFLVFFPVVGICIWLQVRYAPHMPLVLRGITCTFHGGTKTGIVGRTGSGKSTLIQTLFRLVEPASGKITIDGINISSIGLHDLRSRLSIIPQDPTMFNGTVRSNMDPLEDYTDDQIWEALDKCQIGDEIRTKEGQLDAVVTENGENWSMGQRQLICLGRVLLKKSKILVLDEATASVDTATDNMIQKTLREHFSDSTVIAIAHRITSVVKSDMVLVLNNGLVEEYDSPTALLEDKSSSFSQLVAEYSMRSNSGHSMT